MYFGLKQSKFANMESQREHQNKQVAIWLMIGVGMLIVQILIGGVTRLTGSGLSITEWKPILGLIPPLNEQQWGQAFQMYQEKTGQFKYLNNDFTLSQFKFIYFWEWFHRAWARFIGIVFLIPFFYFIYKKAFNKDIIIKLFALFLLGVGQGLIGWIMVKSGLNDDNLYVSHIRLAVHFISALILVAFTFWFALTLMIPQKQILSNPKMKNWLIFILFFLMILLTYGVFLAGLKAATAATTWPSINGSYFPDSLANGDFLYDKINIHFIHRTLAYLLLFIITYFTLKANRFKDSNLFNQFKFYPIILMLLQIVVGILTIINANNTVRNGFGAFETFAQIHQIIPMFLLLSILTLLYSVRATK